MREMLLDPRRAAATAGVKALHDKGPADRRLLDVEAIDIELVIVLGVGDRRLQYLLDVLRDAAPRKGQFGERLVGILAADRLRDEVELARADAQPAEEGGGFGVVEAALGRGLAHLRSFSPACRRRGRRRCGSARTRRICGRSCFRSPAPG